MPPKTALCDTYSHFQCIVGSEPPRLCRSTLMNPIPLLPLIPDKAYVRETHVLSKTREGNREAAEAGRGRFMPPKIALRDTYCRSSVLLAQNHPDFIVVVF